LDAGKWFDREFMGERIPTLEEVLEFSSEHDVVFYLEVKYDSAWGMHHALVAALQKAHAEARTVVISFDPATLKAVHRLDPSLMTGVLFERPNPDFVTVVTGVGARQICPASKIVTPELVVNAHQYDLHVATWTVNTVKEMQAMMAAGVDGIMTDFP